MANPTPAELGYRLVPDSAGAGRYWLAWPRPAEREARDAVLTLAAMLSDWAPVTILACPADLPEVSLRTPSDVTTMVMAHDGARLKPVAPLFLRRSDDGSVAALLPSSPVAQAFAEHLNCPMFIAPPWFRSDYIDVDGSGMLLASEAMLRFGERGELEELLQRLTGTERVVWLNAGLEGADGAVTAVARCLGPGLAMTMVEEEGRGDQGPALLRDVAARLAEANFTVFPVPRPNWRRGRGNRRRPACYTHCVVSDQGIIMPAFEEARDALAVEVLSAAVPDRKIGREPARELLRAKLELSSLVVMQPPMPRNGS